MPHVEIPQAELKLVILGDANCGKTSLVTRFTQGYFRQQHHHHSSSTSSPTSSSSQSSSSIIQQSRHNPNFVTKSIPVTSSNIPTKIQIWDVAGQNSNNTNKHTSNKNNSTVNGAHTTAKCYYSTSSAILLGYDVTSRSSYEGMRAWLNELRTTISFHVVVVAIVALKTDLLHVPAHGGGAEVAVQEYEVEQLAQALNVLYVPTSSKLDVNVTSLFSRVAEEVLVRRKRGSNSQNGNLLWNNGGASLQFSNGGGRRKKERASSGNTETTRSSSPMSSKELYGKYYGPTDNTTTNTTKSNGGGNHNTVDGGNHDHLDDSNTSSSMMLPNNDMVSGSNNNNDGNDATTTITSSSNTDVRSTPVATMTSGGQHNEEEAAAAGGARNERGETNECDITTEVIHPNKDVVLDGEEEDGEANGSFFMMCGVCGKTSDTIE
eukprot:CAMPEP_0201688922 /NCGR_PEP_ID=MMETSP0578-20130828/2587_1 /ASSEMBLY_ACC=CAM_ASM_000663 /TAXON_ID=267565 /ORGANISM="Skeletonema grethea, Strain CCMP 1804" /LENGTH=433 /DNA_ID=CAMNT_0048173401 /DNA_START=47 /DNA_END=1348 /DNA_ORIENTATION=+